MIIQEALTRQATHLLLEPTDRGLQVVFVVDGNRVEKEVIPKTLGEAVILRLRILAGVDVADRTGVVSGTIAKIADTSVDAAAHFAVTPRGETALIELRPGNAVAIVVDWWNQVGAKVKQ